MYWSTQSLLCSVKKMKGHGNHHSETKTIWCRLLRMNIEHWRNTNTWRLLQKTRHRNHLLAVMPHNHFVCNSNKPNPNNLLTRSTNNCSRSPPRSVVEADGVLSHYSFSFSFYPKQLFHSFVWTHMPTGIRFSFEFDEVHIRPVQLRKQPNQLNHALRTTNGEEREKKNEK